MTKLIAILLFALAFKAEAQNFPQAAVYPVQTVRKVSAVIPQTYHYLQQDTIRGNGAATRTFSVHLNPDIFQIKGADAHVAVWKTSDMGTDSAFKSNTDSSLFGGMISFNGSDSTVTIHFTNEMNQNTIVYYWFAARKEYGKIGLVKWTGNQTLRNIPALFDGVKPAFLVAKPNTINASYNYDYAVSDSMTNDTVCALKTTGSFNNTATLKTDTLHLTASQTMNQTGTFFRGFWFARVTDSIWVNKYTGTGIAQSIVMTTKTPQLIWITGINPVQKLWFSSLTGGTISTGWWTNSAISGSSAYCTAINSNGYTIGTASQINNPGTNYYSICFVMW